jgi:DNA-binding MarR family transcriptional regulator
MITVMSPATTPHALELVSPAGAVESQGVAFSETSSLRPARTPVWPHRPSVAESVEEIGPTGSASTRMLGLWIDLLRQAGDGPTPVGAQAQGELGRRHFNALDILRRGPRSSHGLALGIGVSPAAALALVDHLLGMGLVERSGDGVSGSGWMLSTTAAGVRLVARDRRAQLVSLRLLLGQLGPARLQVMKQAMAQLARAYRPLQPVEVPAQAVPARRRTSLQPSSPPGGPPGRRGSGLPRPTHSLRPVSSARIRMGAVALDSLEK